MLYGTEGGGHGRKSKYTVLPRGSQVQFEEAAKAGLSNGQGCPAGEFEKQNCTRPPGSTISKVKLFSAAPREDRIF